MDELTLLARARALDNNALAQIHEQYYRPIFRYIVFRVTDQQLAEDLTSEVFIRLLTALRDKSAPQNTIRGWLYSVASRVVADHFRKTGRTEQVALTDMLTTDEDAPEEMVAKTLSAEKVQAAMAHLTEEQQRVLALRFGFGMRIREVAETIGKSEGAVKQLQLRALSTLSSQVSVGSETA